MNMLSKLKKSTSRNTPWFVFCLFFSACAYLFFAGNVFAQGVSLGDIRAGKVTKQDLDGIRISGEFESAIRLIGQNPNTDLLAITIPFNISPLYRENHYYNQVYLYLIFEAGAYQVPRKADEDLRIVYALPFNIDRSTDVEKNSEFSTGLSASISKLTAKIGVTHQNSESYSRLYRSVAVSLHKFKVYWTFRPFSDEPLPPGANVAIILAEVPKGVPNRNVTISLSCELRRKKWLGLDSEQVRCPGATWRGVAGPNGAQLLSSR